MRPGPSHREESCRIAQRTGPCARSPPRPAHWRGTATPVGLDKFTRAESVALLGALAPTLTAGNADRVAAAVGDLSLAIDQAGHWPGRARPPRRRRRRRALNRGD